MKFTAALAQLLIAEGKVALRYVCCLKMSVFRMFRKTT
jgi:hypothetical protein